MNKLKQEQIINEVRTIDTRYSNHGIVIGNYNNERTEIIYYPKQKCSLFFPAGQASDVILSPQTFKVLDFLLMNLPLERNMNKNDMFEYRNIEKPISEWCRLFGIEYQTENLKILKRHLVSMTIPVIRYKGCTVIRDRAGDVIYNKSEGKKGRKRKEREKSELFFHLLDDVKITDGYIKVKLNESFLELIADYSYDMIYNPKIFAINTHKYPNSYNFAIRLLVHAKMNKTKFNAFTIPVTSLIASTDIIPNREDLSRQNSFVERIVVPFERDMNALSDNGILISEPADPGSSTPEYKGWHYMLDGRRYEGKVNSKVFYELDIEFHLKDM